MVLASFMGIDRSVCSVCARPSQVLPAYTGHAYCLAHFRSFIEKRVRKDLRTNQPIDVRQEYVFKDDGTPLAGLTLSMLRSIFGEQLLLRHDAHAEPGPFVIVPSCLDMDASEQFRKFVAKESFLLPGIRPLRTVMAEDVRSLLGGDAFSYSAAHPLLLELERLQPGTFFGVLSIFGEREQKKINE